MRFGEETQDRQERTEERARGLGTCGVELSHTANSTKLHFG